MKTVRVFLAACAFTVIGGTAFAQIAGSADKANSNTLITSVQVSGIERTQPHVAEYPLKKFIGQEASTLDHDAVKAAVMDTGILEPLTVEVLPDPGGNDYILKVTVEEKWPIIPIPMFEASSDGMSAGLIVLDSNAFGLGDQLALGGAYGSGWTALGKYTHTPSQDGVPGWNIAGMYSREERRDADQEDEDLRRFKLDTLIASLGLSYSLTDSLDASIDAAFHDRVIRGGGDPLNVPGDDARAITLTPALSLETSSWDGYLLSRKNAKLEYVRTAGIDSPSFHTTTLEVIFEQPIVPGFRVNFEGGLHYSPGATELFETDPSAAKVNILPDGFSARSYAGASIGLEKYLYKFSWGTLSLVGAYQAVWSEGPILEDEFDQGAAGFLRLYLSKLALPAVSLGVVRNFSSDYTRVVFNLGISL
jgi:outer membrane protein assembly factor BamA